MAVRGVVLDLDGTLLTPVGTAAPGVGVMLDELRGMGISIAVASGRPGLSEAHIVQRLANAGLRADIVLARDALGQAKGAKIWVGTTCAELSLAPNELVWLGDSDGDMRSAVNTHVIYFNAAWSNPGYPYGIHISRPGQFSMLVRECFAKNVNWYWQLSETDMHGWSVTDRAMIDGFGANIPALKNDLLQFLKYRGEPTVGPLKVRDFIMLHLLGSIYGEGLHLRADTWTVYPGSSGGPNKEMGFVIDHIVKQFRDRYVPDLLIRHTKATDSGQARWQGGMVDFANQVNTVRLNPNERKRVSGKAVLVVDDFETQGWSAECARNLLMQAGAREVICVSIGKYPKPRHVLSSRDATWDPYVAQQHPATRFADATRAGLTDPSALTLMRDSYQRVGARK